MKINCGPRMTREQRAKVGSLAYLTGWDRYDIDPFPVRFRFGMVAVDHDRDGIDHPFRDGIQDFSAEIENWYSKWDRKIQEREFDNGIRLLAAIKDMNRRRAACVD